MKKITSKYGPNALKYISITVILLVLALGANKFVFSRGASTSESNSENSPTQIALDYYFENYGDPVEENSTEAVLKNFGCHSEIHILKDNELVMRFQYANGQLYEIQ